MSWDSGFWVSEEGQAMIADSFLNIAENTHRVFRMPRDGGDPFCGLAVLLCIRCLFIQASQNRGVAAPPMRVLPAVVMAQRQDRPGPGRLAPGEGGDLLVSKTHLFLGGVPCIHPLTQRHHPHRRRSTFPQCRVMCGRLIFL